MIRKIVLATIGIWFTASLACASDTVIVADSSGSMKGNEKNMQVAIKKALQKDINVIGFGSYIYTIRNEKDYHLNGTTNLSLALEDIDKNYPNTRYVIIASDGIPDDINAVKKISDKLKGKGIKFCSSFIGIGQVPAILKEISDITFISNVDLAIAKCSNKRVKRKLIGSAVRKKIDINAFAF
jgi:hypothetical protein